MSVPATDARFTLRDLPFPAKLVITCFLLSVGLGYTSAMLQLHFQDAKTGEPMPTVADVVVKYTGKRWFTEPPPPPTSMFVKLITTPDGTFGSGGTMMPAFFDKCSIYRKTIRENKTPKMTLDAEREGERDSLVVWAKAPDDERRKAYEADNFAIPADKMPKALTAEMKTGIAVKVKTIIDSRCVSCHAKGQSQESYPLETYSQIEKYLAVPEQPKLPPGGGWLRVETPIGMEKLTQSTHAHLLSFSVLFSLTGLVFAFTSYPTFLRVIVSPLVLLAVVTDVSFWWLARLSDSYGVYFAMGIMGTGAVAGSALGLQIFLGLWNLYDRRGKVMIALIFATWMVVGALVMKNVAMPAVEAKKAEIEAKAKAEADKKAADAKPPEKKPDDKKKEDVPTPKALGPSKFDEVLRFPLKDSDGMVLAVTKMPFTLKEEPKNMVRAMFDKDGADFNKINKDPCVSDADKKKLNDERFGELAALTAWTKLPDAARRAAWNADAFALPPELVKKPITADFAKNGNVLIKSLLTDRCIRCHADEPLTAFKDYDTMKPLLEPQAIVEKK